MKRQSCKKFCRVLAGLLLLLGTAHAQFDGGAKENFDLENGLPPRDLAGTGESTKVGLDIFTWTLGTKASLDVEGNPEWVDTHGWVRGQARTPVGDRYFASLEGRLLFLPPWDHRATASHGEDGKDKKARLTGRLKKAVIQADYGGFNLSAGYQILVWGKADASAITDVVSPRDREDLIFQEVEDMRFGQWTLAGEVFSDRGSLQCFISPLAGTDRLPDPGHRYHVESKGKFREKKPTFGEVEAGIRLDLTHDKTELALMGGWFRINSPVIEESSTNGEAILDQVYPEFAMAGLALSHVQGNFLLKTELALKINYPLQGRADSRFFYRRTELADAALGVEFTSNDQTRLTLELSHRHLFSPPKELTLDHRDQSALYLTLGKKFLRETLDLEYQFYYHLAHRDHCHGFKADYELSDALEARFRYHCLGAGGPATPLGPHRDEDRISLELIYHL